MPGRGKRGNSRGRGSGRGSGRGRGRGFGSIGGGGRGRNRELAPSAVGYVYRPRSNVDDEEDFRVYGQFSSDETDSGNETSFKKHSPKKKAPSAQKNKLGFVRESRPSFGSNYDSQYDDAMERAGLGMSRSAANDSKAEDQFAQGNSKYYKTVLFTKSEASNDLSKVNEKVVIQKRIVEELITDKTETVVESFTKLTVNDFIKSDVDEKEAAKLDLLSMLRSNSNSARSSPAVDASEHIVEIESNTKVQVVESIPVDDKEASLDDEESSDLETDTDEVEPEDSSIESDEEEEEEELFYEEDDTEDDELLEEDMRIMEDYMEHIELEEGEDLNDLLAWSAMQEGNLELESDSSDLYDYASLDKSAEVELNDFEEDTKAILLESKKRSKPVEESSRRKVNHRIKDEESIVDPEIFGQSLKAALADCPPGLRPGMRRWYEKQQRKEDRKQKKEEAKAHRREKKKKNSKGTQQNDDDFTDQMLKIDGRINEFILDDSISSLQLAPSSTNVRRQTHVLAAAYNLKSKSSGGGGSRCTVITKTPTTRIPTDRRYISRFLSDIQTNVDEQNRIIGKNRSKGVALKGKKKVINAKNKNSSNPKDKRGDNQFPAGPTHGTVVAHDAAPIAESNVGHRMLAAMGWRQGEALGSKSEGIIAPIEAIIRRKGRGLGS